MHVELSCPGCTLDFKVAADEAEAKCPECGRLVRSVVCQYCEVPFEAVVGQRVTCPRCGVIARRIEEVRGVTFGGRYCQPVRLVRFAAHVVDGLGWVPVLGGECDLEIGDDSLSLIQHGGLAVTVPLSGVRDVRVEGTSVSGTAAVFRSQIAVPGGGSQPVTASSIFGALADAAKRAVTVRIITDWGSVSVKVRTRMFAEEFKAVAGEPVAGEPAAP